MDVLEKAKSVPHEPEGKWIEKMEGGDHDINDHFGWDKKYLGPLRKLCRKAEKKFAEHVPEHVEFFSSDAEGVSPSVVGENMDVEVVSRGDWKKLRREVADEQLFDFVLFEAVSVHLIFYQRDSGAVDMPLEEFAERSVEDKNSNPCLSRVAETCLWLKEKIVPEELNARQGRLLEFGGA